MNRAEFVACFKSFTGCMVQVMEKKNADYSGASDDPFANFSAVKNLGICSVEAGFLTRMSDKLSRIASFAKRGELSVKDESAEDTLLDLANYSILLACYLRAQRQAKMRQEHLVDQLAGVKAADPEKGLPSVFNPSYEG